MAVLHALASDGRVTFGSSVTSVIAPERMSDDQWHQRDWQLIVDGLIAHFFLERQKVRCSLVTTIVSHRTVHIDRKIYISHVSHVTIFIFCLFDLS